jgi:hypothetical protein
LLALSIPDMNELEELLLRDLKILGVLLRIHASGHRALQGIPGGLQELEGTVVVFFQATAPGLFGFPGGLLERLAFQDEGGKLDGPVSGGSRGGVGWVRRAPRWCSG